MAIRLMLLIKIIAKIVVVEIVVAVVSRYSKYKSQMGYLSERDMDSNSHPEEDESNKRWEMRGGMRIHG